MNVLKIRNVFIVIEIQSPNQHHLWNLLIQSILYIYYIILLISSITGICISDSESVYNSSAEEIKDEDDEETVISDDDKPKFKYIYNII